MMRSRALLRGEISLIPPSFQAALPLKDIRLISRAHNPFALGKILVRDSKIYWPEAPADFTRESLTLQAILIHELCHVWQYRTDHLTALRYLTRPANWAYKYAYNSTKKFEDYPIEKQADLMQDWYRVNRGGTLACCAPGYATPTRTQLNALIPFEWPSERGLG